ncbi:hypothetical protein GGR56DRAFT_310320 [Xylariaceae sp. FL0804]|nr:hypothetical protein GGR56DRAFT_310320 [Xylariaceae sp. FL0804]
MDGDTTSLAAELLHKLAELDQKVSDYRLEMAQQFKLYSAQLLQHVPADVSARVEDVVAGQVQNYPALRPALGTASDSPPPAGSSLGDAHNRRPSAPPLVLHTSGLSPVDSLHSERVREREFHGLFTPSYLPLLDAVPRDNKTTGSNTTPGTTTLPAAPANRESNSTQDPSSPCPPTTLSAPSQRLEPVRYPTDDNTSSVTSDDSTARLRRSAMRRSSSSSIRMSPRRVRFDVEGEEVLPTVSPPMSPQPLECPVSTQAQMFSTTTLLDESPGAVVMNGTGDLLGSSPPRPKKVTSTERLKAMTRNSTEDTSTWTIVGSLQGEDAEEDELVMAPSSKRRTHGDADGVSHRNDDMRRSTQSDFAPEADIGTGTGEAARENEDDDDLLAMPPLSSFKGKKRFSSSSLEAGTEAESGTTAPETPRQTKSAAPNSQMHKPIAATPDDESLFEFEEYDGEDSGSVNGRIRQGVSKYIEEIPEVEEGDEEGGITPMPQGSERQSKPSPYSSSPAMSMTRRPKEQPTSAESSRTTAPSAGSYRGKPFNIGVVRNEELYKQASDMGNFSSFVGSVDGRSGVDESSSYRPCTDSFTGTPRSLSERLMLEDIAEARRDGGGPTNS